MHTDSNNQSLGCGCIILVLGLIVWLLLIVRVL